MNNRFITAEKSPDGNTSVKILEGNNILSFSVCKEGYALFSNDEDVFVYGEFYKYIKSRIKSIEELYKKLHASFGFQPLHHFTYLQLKEALEYLREIRIHPAQQDEPSCCSL